MRRDLTHYSRRSEILTLAACVLVSLLLMALPADPRTMVADRLGRVLTAPYWSVRNFAADVFVLRDQKTELERRLVELEMQVAAGDRLQRDMDRLAGPALDAGYAGELVPCRVVMRQRSRFATMIKVHSEVPVAWRPWLPVITRAGYLGRLRTVVSATEAWVELMTSPDFALGVELERTGLLGILRPQADRFVVEMVGRDEDVQEGDVVITSGIAEIREGAHDPAQTAVIPRGFPVGVVSAVLSPNDEVFKDIELEPAAAFQHNETVFVITSLQGAPVSPDGSTYPGAPSAGGALVPPPGSEASR